MIAGITRPPEHEIPLFRRMKSAAGELPVHQVHLFSLVAIGLDADVFGAAAKYICVEAYRNEREKVNLMYWQLTCRAFHTPEEWDFVFRQAGYTGDHEFIYFE